MSMLEKGGKHFTKKVLGRPHNHVGFLIRPPYLPDFPLSHRYLLHLIKIIVFAGTSLATLLVHLSFYILNVSLFLLLPTLTFGNPGFLTAPPPNVFNVMPASNPISCRIL